MVPTRTAHRPHGPGCCCTSQCTAEWRSKEPEDSHQGRGGGVRDELHGQGPEEPPLPRSPARSTSLWTTRACGSSVGSGRIQFGIQGRRWWLCGTAASATRSSSTSACRSRIMMDVKAADRDQGKAGAREPSSKGNKMRGRRGGRRNCRRHPPLLSFSWAPGRREGARVRSACGRIRVHPQDAC